MTVTIYSSEDTDAPTLTGEVGTLINLLQKCLVDGYGNQSAAGWTSQLHSSGEKAAFQSGDANSSQHWFYIDDTGAKTSEGAKMGSLWGYATFSGYDGSGVPQGTDKYPNAGDPDTQGGIVPKSSSADTSVRPWRLIVGRSAFYFFSGINSSGASAFASAEVCFTFAGDYVPIHPNATTPAMISANAQIGSVDKNYYLSFPLRRDDGNQAKACVLGSDIDAGSVGSKALFYTMGQSNDNAFQKADWVPGYNGADSWFPLFRHYVAEAGYYMNGRMPGLWIPFFYANDLDRVFGGSRRDGDVTVADGTAYYGIVFDSDDGRVVLFFEKSGW